MIMVSNNVPRSGTLRRRIHSNLVIGDDAGRTLLPSTRYPKIARRVAKGSVSVHRQRSGSGMGIPIKRAFVEKNSADVQPQSVINSKAFRLVVAIIAASPRRRR